MSISVIVSSPTEVPYSFVVVLFLFAPFGVVLLVALWVLPSQAVPAGSSATSLQPFSEIFNQKPQFCELRQVFTRKTIRTLLPLSFLLTSSGF